MTSARTAVRAAAVLGATAALTVAGAGAAFATTATPGKDGTTVSVTFALEEGAVLGDLCGAALVEPQAAAELAGAFTGGDLEDIFTSLASRDGVTLLRTGGLVSTPIATLTPIVKEEASVSASDVPAGLYALISVCASAPSDPSITTQMVGDPIEVITGSLGAMSSGEGAGLDTLSSVLGGGDTEGALDLGTLSSALGETEN
ncbi:hypothetical protein [Dietzia sp. CH92]|uniref:hypothetical protein n=1 Tax=Dietzia sp. CH92 TaxID=3051823 RepID=UPI0028D0B1B2|nr:hypothetical protein [Dietzia sp. CH92]